MNRDILFRGKQIDGGECVEGFYFNRKTQHYIKALSLRNGVDVLTDYEVDPDTVGEYTGLQDKNGKDIYEGDVCRDSLGWVFEVRWDSENARFLGHHDEPRGDTYICYIGREPAVEIIGNIHDEKRAQMVEQSKEDTRWADGEV